MSDVDDKWSATVTCRSHLAYAAQVHSPGFPCFNTSPVAWSSRAPGSVTAAPLLAVSGTTGGDGGGTARFFSQIVLATPAPTAAPTPKTAACNNALFIREGVLSRAETLLDTLPRSNDAESRCKLCDEANGG